LKKRNERLLVTVGNILDHYELSLYGFLAPVIAPLFFPQSNPINRLFLAYGLLGLGTLMRPLGAFVGAYCAKRYGPLRGLVYAVSITGGCTLFFGLAPLYEWVGIWGGLYLLIFRCLTELGVTTERTIARMFLVTKASEAEAIRWTGFYEGFSMVGVLLASVASLCVLQTDALHFWWRLPYLLGSLSALILFLLRWKFFDQSQQVNISALPTGYLLLRSAWGERRRMFQIILVTAFSLLPYYFSFIFLNGFVPLITQISLEQMLGMGTFFLGLDGLLFMGLGHALSYFSARRIMIITATIITLCSYPFFQGLEGASFMFILWFRLAFILLGVAFSCPITLWKRNMLTPKNRYFIAGLSDTFGSLIARNLVPLGFLLYEWTGDSGSPGWIFIIMGIISLYTLLKKQPIVNKV
jgi:MFS family permease